MRRRWKLERELFERGYAPKEVVAELRRRGARDDERLSARLVVRPILPYPGLREVLGSFRSPEADPVRWSTRADRRGPMSVVDIDGDCPAGSAPSSRRRSGLVGALDGAFEL